MIKTRKIILIILIILLKNNAFASSSDVLPKDKPYITFFNATSVPLYVSFYYDMGLYYERPWSIEKRAYLNLIEVKPNSKKYIIKPPRKRKNLSINTYKRHLLIAEKKDKLVYKIHLDDDGKLPLGILPMHMSEKNDKRFVICDGNMYKPLISEPIPSCIACSLNGKDRDNDASCKVFFKTKLLSQQKKIISTTKTPSQTPPNSLIRSSTSDDDEGER